MLSPHFQVNEDSRDIPVVSSQNYAHTFADFAEDTPEEQSNGSGDNQTCESGLHESLIDFGAISTRGDTFQEFLSKSVVSAGEHHLPESTRAEPTFPLQQNRQQSNTTSVLDETPPLSQHPSRETGGETPQISYNSATHNIGDTSESGIGPRQTSRLPIKESLGVWGSLIIIGGSVAIIGILSFLMFLWFGHGTHEAEDATRAWRQIALQGWMTQSVTLSSLALRLAISMQAAVCTSMLAALVLEKRPTPKFQVAWFSIIRSTNDGPLNMVRMMLSSKIFIRYAEFWLLSLLAITTLGLQFSSTILLSDITDLVVVGNVRQVQLPGLFDVNDKNFEFITSGTGDLATKPTYSIFSEINKSSNVSADALGLSQTGLVQRAFLPLSKPDDRTSIRQFRGNAIIMSSSIACMRPRIRGAILDVRMGPDYSIFASVKARLQYDLSIREVEMNANASCTPGTCDEIGFNCAVPVLSTGFVTAGWESLACYIGTVGGQTVTSFSRPRWNSSQEPWVKNTPIYIVTTANIRSSTKIQGIHEFPTGLDNAEWASFEVFPGQFVNISLCFPAFALSRELVTMTASWDLKEPTTQSSLVSSKHNTSEIQKYMGSNLSPVSFANRGILDLQLLGSPEDGPPTSPANLVPPPGHPASSGKLSSAVATPLLLEWTQFLEFIFGATANATLTLCPTCALDTAVPAHPEMALLFSDTIAQTGRAVNALFSLITTVAMTINSDYLTARTIQDKAQVVSTTVVKAPSKCKENGCPGLVTVTVLVAVHLLYVGIITILYTMKVRYSRYGNIWHAVSQLISDETKETLDVANNKSDEGVFKDKENAGKDELVKLARLENGRIEIVKHHPDTKTSGPSSVTKLREKLRTVKWTKKGNGKETAGMEI
ncbi:hypothetical protein F4678DRAFT_483968 [Xylaria arbuscula]|nr:hypothetical protein F4678DRAFT_483968 [Xylaria arbuscula]